MESSDDRGAAVLLGLPLGLLASSGVAAFTVHGTAAARLAALRSDRRAAAAPAAVAAVAVVAVASVLGLARSPLDFGEIPTWIPEATASGILLCTGASFTRVAGLEYQLAVSHAREVIPLTAFFVGLMAWGAARLPARARGLLVAGALLPFALGATLALATGRVTPLQASRLLAALPFVAILMAVGLASLRGLPAWAAGAAAGGALVSFLTLTLLQPDYEVSPKQALARELARCGSGATVMVAVQRPLDLLALAAWDVPGPFVLRAARAPVPDGPAIVVGPVLGLRQRRRRVRSTAGLRPAGERGRAIIRRWETPPGPGRSNGTASCRSRACCGRPRSRSAAPSTTSSSPGRSTSAGGAPTSGAGAPSQRPGVENITQVMWPSVSLPALRTSPAYERALAVAREILGDDLAFDFDMLIDKAPGTATPTPWHQDFAYWIDLPDRRAASCWIALDDATLDNGCMWFVRRVSPAPDAPAPARRERAAGPSSATGASRKACRCPSPPARARSTTAGRCTTAGATRPPATAGR